MSKFVLTPCRILIDRLVAVKGAEPQVFESMEALIKRFAPTRQRIELQNLTALRRGSFMGMVQGSRSGKPTLFVLLNKDMTNQIGWLLKQQPTLPTRLIELYRVDEAVYDAKVTEGEVLAKTG